jgi:hypothetical protein
MAAMMASDRFMRFSVSKSCSSLILPAAPTAGSRQWANGCMQMETISGEIAINGRDGFFLFFFKYE